MRSEGYGTWFVCVCVCVCVCLWGEKSGGICGNCEKGKVKESERRMSTSVMKSFSAFVHG